MASCFLIASLLISVGGDAAAPPTDVRVAIVAYEDFRQEFERFETLFAELSRRDSGLRFRLAVGSYGDVLHWMDRGLIDMAVLTPGVFAGVLADEAVDGPPAYRYLATVRLRRTSSKWDKRADGFHENYRSVCLVSAGSELRTVDDLRRAASKRQVEMLFVHPLSVSGYAAPQEALRKAEIVTDALPRRFTYSHTASLRMLQEHAERDRVAFVWVGASANDVEFEIGTQQLIFPELDELEIPNNVIVTRTDFEHDDRVKALLINGLDANQPFRFSVTANWRNRFGTVRDWLTAVGAASPDDGERTSLDEIGQILLQSARSQPFPPRLALVLSGGGAKCSYQVGAVAALEEKLDELRRQNPENGLDIALVVGTSGGAINALPIAMGISRSEDGRQTLRDIWMELDQRDLFQPSLLIRTNMGLWFALLQTAIVIWIIRRFVPRQEHRGRIFAISFTALAAVEILIGYLPSLPWSWLGTNHFWHHAWLWLSLGVHGAAWSLFVIGIAALTLETIKAKQGRHLSIPSWFTKTTLWIGLLGLPILQAITILFFVETISGGQGMERTLSEKFPRLIDQDLDRRKLPPLELGDLIGPAGRLQAVSRQLLNRNLLKRDLVITGSCLATQTSERLPTDLYFYAAANPQAAPPPFGKKGVSLLKRPDTLLDVVMGSGSIFPVFPARTINDVPRKGDRIELVDGGFAHNSPIEAAVLWGATHIVLIEATPRKKRTERRYFLQNATSSFHHLYQQAQLLDARSREQVIVFSLAPKPPHMCVLDFADNLIAASIQRGYDDARITHETGAPRFRKEPGEPVFVHVNP
jgi:predicted acylesterase/phospholipase RssA/ABC-type phosphate/phosphonate transport system substrate-binding protein